MRTNIEIDDALMARAMAAAGLSTKRETVDAALRLLAQRRRAYAAALALGGQLNWQGDLDADRRDMGGDAAGGALPCTPAVHEAVPAFATGGRKPPGRAAGARRRRPGPATS